MHGSLPTTLTDAFRRSRSRNRGVLFALAGGRRRELSYSDLWDLACTRLGELRASGLRQGDRALIVTDDLEKFIVHFWACLLGGIVAVPIATPGNREIALKLAGIVATLGDPWLLTDETVLSRLPSLAPELDDTSRTLLLALEHKSVLAEVPEANEVRDDVGIAPVRPDDVAFIQFSSGSTGNPKGVTLTHDNLIQNLRAIAEHLDVERNGGKDRLLSWMPVTHDFGIIWFHLFPVAYGLDHCLLPTRLFIRNALSWPQWASEFRATVMGGPTFGYRHVLKNLDKSADYGWDLSAVRTITNGAEPIIPQLTDAFMGALAPYGLKASSMTPAYGLAEATLLVTIAPIGELPRVLAVDRLTVSPGDRVRFVDGSTETDVLAFVDVGKPIGDTEVRIADDEGGWCGEDTVGLIKVRGPCVMQGYVNAPEATAAAIDADGWLDTGDLGFLHEGHLVITGRRKDVIIVNGVNFYPQDIERVASEVEGLDLNKVAACAVPRPDGEGEALALFVQFRRAIDAFAPLAAQVCDKVVREVGIPVDYCLPIPRTPRTTSGKLQRFKLAQQFANGAFDTAISDLHRLRGGEGSSLREAWQSGDRRAVLDALLDEAARIGPGGTPSADRPLMDSGFTSMRLVELHGRINRALGLDLPVTLMFDCPTPSALADELIAGKRPAAKVPTSVGERGSKAEDGAAFAASVIGFGLRLPGGVANLADLGRALEAEFDAITDLPADRGWPDAAVAQMATARAGWLQDISAFDARLFRISPVEAEAMDPQQRLLLTTSWEAFEDAGIDPLSLEGSRTGVFVGIGSADYVQAQARTGDLSEVGPYSFTGTSASVAAGRLSFFYGLRGPCVATDTACSSGLVALHQAMRSLRAGDCDTALVCGVNLMLSPEMTVSLTRMNALSAEGRCAAFGDSADGYVRGEGCISLVVTRRDIAERQGRPAHAVILGGAVNHDGASNGLTAPNGTAQAELLHAALEDARVGPETVDYVEAHGTGTLLGDPVEAMALAQVFGPERPADRPLMIGSVKSNIGHLEAASGLAGFAKVAAAFALDRLPSSLHVETLNRRISWNDIPLSVVGRTASWPQIEGRPRRAGVSSFGMSGTNVHVVVEAPSRSDPVESAVPADLLLPVSAHSREALMSYAHRWADAVEAGGAESLVSLAHAAATGRAVLPFRTAVVGGDARTVAERLRAIDGRGLEAVSRSLRVVFAFPGQGSQLPYMGKALAERWPVFGESLLESERRLAGYLDRPLTELLWNLDAVDLAATAVVQPVVVAFGLALADLLRDWGIEPSGTIGHSVGEIAAAIAAGALDRGEGLCFAAARGRLMQELPAGGAMAAVMAPAERLQEVLDATDGRVVAAALNAPGMVTLSGAADALDAVLEKVSADGVRCSRLDVSHAFHSPLMEPALDALGGIASRLKGGEAPLPVYSALTGEVAEPGCYRSADFWVRHAREPVRFADAVRAIPSDEQTLVVELGGRAVLAPLAAATSAEVEWLAGHRPDDPVQSVLSVLGRLFETGAEVAWPRVFAGQTVRPVRGPTYPFQGQVRVLPSVREAGLSATVRREAAPVDFDAVETPEAEFEGSRQDRLLADIRGILKGIAGLDPATIPANTTWFALGLDSLLIVQLQQGLAKIHGSAPALAEIYEKGDTPERLAALVDGHSPPETVPFGASAEARSEKPAETRTEEVPQVEVKGLFKRGPAKSVNWSAARTAHVRKLAAAWNARSTGSKEMTEEGRAVYANSRATLGFRPEWKELIYPLHVARAAGPHVWDVDGNRYVDITMGFGATLLGHAPAFVREAVQKEMELGAPLGPQTPRAATVARMISEMTGVERCAFFTTGSEAVMVAVRLARAVTGRNRIVMFVNSYHGTFDGLLAVGWARNGEPVTVPLTDGTPQGMIEDVIVLRYGDPEALDVIREHADSLAAVLVEPVQSRDPAVQPVEFVKELRTLTAERDIALIFDEMIVGFRVHPGGAQHHFGVEADIVTYGKIVGGGLPIGVVAGKAKYLDAVDGGVWQYGDDSGPSARTAFVAGTFNNHPLTMAAAEATLTHLREAGPALQERLSEKTAELCRRLTDLFEAERVPIRMVHFASLFRFEFAGDTEVLNYHLLNNGIFVWEGRNCFLSTEHSDADLDAIVDAAARGIRAMRADGWFDTEEKTGVPLWRGQKEILALAAGYPDAVLAYTETVALDLRGDLDTAALERALAALQARHEALRVNRIDGATWDVSAEPLAALEHQAVDDSDSAVTASLQAALAVPFDLRNGPLFRTLLLRRKAERHILVLLVHHLVADGWSLALIANDLAALYAAETSGDFITLGEPIPYRAFADWLARTPAPDAGQAVDAPPLTLPRRDLPETSRFAGSRLAWADPAFGENTVFGGVKTVAKRLGLSPVAVLFAGYAVLLGRLSNQTRFTIGLPVAGHAEAGLLNMVGHASVVAPVAVALDPVEPFVDLARRVGDQLIGLQGDLRRLLKSDDAAGSPVNALFNVDRGLVLEMPDLAADWVSAPMRHVKLDVFLNIVEVNGAAWFELDCAETVANAETQARWMESLIAILTGALTDEKTALRDLPLSAADREVAEGESDRRVADGFGQPAAIGVFGTVERLNGKAWEATGDLGRYGRDGSVEILGPVNRVVPLDGRPIDLRRIEQALKTLPDVEAAAALVEAPQGEAKGVTAFVVPARADLSVNDLVRALLEGDKPKRYALVDALPLGVDGEVDRSALAALAVPRESGRVHVAPRTAEEARIVAIWRDVLKVSEVGATDSFFDLGGHSLKALQILGRIESEFGRAPDLNGFFQDPTVAGLAESLRYSLSRAPIPSLPEAEDYAPSHAQARLWMLEQLSPGLTAYNIAFSLDTSGAVDEAALRRSLNGLTERHESLRTVLVDCDGLPRQKILPAHDVTLDIETVADADAARNAALKMAAEPFDLVQQPPWRVRLLRWSVGSRLVVVVHHIISDVWSLGVMIRDLLALYEEERGGVSATLPDLKIQYRDYAAWDEGRQDAVELDWWRRALADPPPPVDLPADRVRPPVQTHAGDRVTFSLSAPASAELRTLASEARVSTFTVLTAGVHAWLSELTGCRDIVIGNAVAGRDHPDLEDQIGLFVNVVPLRIRGEADDTFSALLERTASTFLETLSHAHVPLDAIVEAVGALRDPSRNPLFDVVLVMDDREGVDKTLEGSGFSLTELPTPTSQFDFTLYVTERPDRFEFVAVYNTDLFDRSTAERFAGQLTDGLTAAVRAPGLTIEDASGGAVSLHQERMWFVDRFERGVLYAEGPTYYAHPLAVRLDSEPDLDRLRVVLADVLARHDILRSTVATEADEPVLRSQSTISAELQVLEGGLDRLLEVALAPFDPAKPPLVRAVLARQPEDEGTLFALAAHQMVADKRSLYAVLAEIVALYGGEALPPAGDFRCDVIAAERRAMEDHEADAQWWRQTLSGFTPLVLPTDRPRPAVHTFSLGRAEASLSAGTVAKLEKLGARRDVLRAAFQAIMQRLSGQSDTIVGEPWEPEGETPVGPATNLLALRLDVPADLTFGDLVERSRNGFLAAADHAGMPFDLVVLAVNPKNDMSRTALFDVLFHYDDAPEPLGGALSGKVVDTGIGWGKYDVVLTARPAGSGMDLSLVYNRDIFDPATGELMLQRFKRLAEGVASGSEKPLTVLDLLDEDERASLLKRASAVAGYPRDLTIHAAFERIASERPDAPAITEGQRTLTYGEVNRAANRLAHHLRDLGVKPDDRVGVYMERSAELPIAFLGILKAGGAYLPIDPDYPVDRAQFMAEDAGVKAIVADPALAEAAAGMAERVVTMDGLPETPDANPAPAAGPHHMAYVIYTSGSTGRPKGVMVEHRNVVQLMFHEGLPFRISARDVWALFHSPSFDFSVWEMYGALLYGGRLVVVPRPIARDTEAWLDLVEREGVTVLNQTPSAFFAFAEAALGRSDLKHVPSTVIFGGEALLPARLTSWHAAYPATRLVNMYGITETTVHVTFAEIGADEIAEGRSVIGEPLPSYGIVLLDDDLRVVPTGVEGEICVTGPGVARGYLNRPELTAERFVSHTQLPGTRLYRSGDLGRLTANGRLIYTGRKDKQVKIRGFRIELGEIETQLMRIGGVDAAVVAAEPDGDSLTAYVVAGQTVGREDIVPALAGKLPDYMIPSRFLRVDAIPMTANGKTDYARLDAEGGTELFVDTQDAPGADGNTLLPFQEQVAAIWRDVLEISAVRSGDNFFELGGHSLKANQVVARIRKVLGRNVSLKDFFSAPTLKDLCDVIEARGDKTSAAIAPAAEPSADMNVDFPLSDPQRRLWLLQTRQPEAVNYNMVGAFRLSGTVDEQALAEAVRALVARHEILRTTFELRGGEPRQVVHPAPAVSPLTVEHRKDSASAEDLIRGALDGEFSHVFDLASGPLFRARLLHLPSGELEPCWALVLNFHHIVSDGWSVTVMLRDLETSYRAARGEGESPAPLTFQYRDYVAWLAGRVASGELEPARRHWLKRFEDGVPVLELPCDHTRPNRPSGRGAIEYRVLDENLSAALRDLAARHQATLFMVLTALIQTQMSLRSGQDDIVIGTPVAGRDSVELESQIGFYLNLLPMRARLDSVASFVSHLDTVRTAVIDAFDHANLPFDRLVEDLDVPTLPGRHPLFDVLLILQNNDPVALDLPGVTASPLRDETVSAKYDLNYMVDDKPALELLLEYALDLFDPQTGAALADEFVALARTVVEEPEVSLVDLRSRFASEPASAVHAVASGGAGDLGEEDW